MQLAVIAKEPRPGRVKTRLCPPATPEQAAAIAEASLRATLATVAATPATRRVLVLDGQPGPWIPRGFEVIAQRGDGLDDRLTHAFADCFTGAPDDPILIVGMDTPQMRPAHLRRAAAALTTRARRGAGTGAVLGPATDGGYWLIGLTRLLDGAIRGVPMSATDTFRHQHERLAGLYGAVAITDVLTDIDTIDEARTVAASVPGTALSRAVRAVDAAQGNARSWRRMSRTARTVPATVPVTFDFPARAR